ncbi:MAG: hypothetical protein IPJ31_12870 [Bacteroidetes bacterium]|nr:hypothetical protein [Bacteroidota bacterium]
MTSAIAATALPDFFKINTSYELNFYSDGKKGSSDLVLNHFILLSPGKGDKNQYPL